ncbi:DDE-type integrase/transposase/recombinase [Acinetobacter nectaris]|nr:DDE-type integrase/transposase/recombinase [Acinetobacter nectaris]
MDKTYININEKLRYLYQDVDSQGQTIDFFYWQLNILSM